MRNILYLREMGMDDATMPGDVKNYRVRVLNNIDILYKNKEYNMFFEFRHGAHWYYRKINKRTGAPLKKYIQEIIIKDGIYIDTEYTAQRGTWNDGSPYFASYRLGDFENEFYAEHHAYTKASILEIVNRYKIGEKYTEAVLIETAAREIVRKKGGFREKDILAEGVDFRTGGDSYFTITDEWNNEHKVLTCHRRIWVQTETGRHLEEVAHCDIDILTGSITG